MVTSCDHGRTEKLSMTNDSSDVDRAYFLLFAHSVVENLCHQYVTNNCVRSQVTYDSSQLSALEIEAHLETGNWK